MANREKLLLDIDELLNKAVADGAFPGATYAVVTKDKAYFGCVGNKENFPKAIKNDLDTIYDMASLTKVTSTTPAILRLLDEGKIRLYDPVKYYLPRFKHDNITLWNLLTHTSGLPEGIYGRKDNLSPSEVWDKIYEVDLLFKPGERIVYSDINFILLGEIVKIVSGMPLDEYAAKYVFGPLKMKDTGFNPLDKERCAATEYRDDLSYHGYVKGYVHDETSFALGGVSGHAGLFSTVKDMSRYLRMYLNDGQLDGERILSKTMIELVYKVQVQEFEGLNKTPVRARYLGFQAKETNSNGGDLISEKTILHTGFTGTNLFIDKEHGIGFVMLTNRVHPTRQNSKHLRVRACVANLLMSRYEELL